jgi:hypothetical protein
MTKLSWIILTAFAAVSALVAAAVVPALTARPTAPAGADTAAETTFYACLTSRHALTRVSVTTPSACPAGTVPVQWQGQAGQPVPSPTAHPTTTSAAPPSPSTSQPATSQAPSTHPTTTSAAPPSPSATSPSASQPPTGKACVTSASNGNCGPYHYPAISNSNGFNTYVGNNCWADPSCRQTVSANNPGDWQVVATEPAGNTGVRTYPNVQQLTNNWPWSPSGCGQSCSDTPIAGLSQLTSSYTEVTPRGGTIAQFAWDIWTNNNAGHPGEIMVWVDNSNRGSGGATQVGSASIAGQAWTIYRYGSGELIWSLGAPGTFAQQGSGTVDLLAILRESIARGLTSPGATIGQIDAGWEICSTGGGPETFTVSRYTIQGS